MPVSLTIETATVGGVVADLSGARVAAVERLPTGAVNRVYKVETADGAAFVVKVFRYAGWPEDGKLACVSQRLAERSVPHPRLLHLTRDGDTFPHGYSVTEYIAGRGCAAALADNSLSLADYCRGVGALLREVHAINFPRFGYLGDCAGTDDDYVEAQLTNNVQDRLREIEDSTLDTEGIARRVEEKVRRLLSPLAARFAPVLVHGDAAPRNTILTGEGRFVLADWDEAVAGIALEDYARLTYLLFHSHDSRRRRDEEIERLVRDAFFAGYGATNFEAEEIERIVAALHTVQAADHLAYYFKTGDEADYAKTKELLNGLL